MLAGKKLLRFNTCMFKENFTFEQVLISCSVIFSFQKNCLFSLQSSKTKGEKVKAQFTVVQK